LYFHVGAERGSQRISMAEDPGSLARSAYTFIPLPLVAGIILVAVGDEFVLAHPTGHTELKVAIAVIAGPIFYVIGNLLFKKATAGWYPLSHLVGLGLLVLWAPTGAILPPLALSFGATLILVLVAAWETLSLRPKEA
jgi:low temperature requirement protein LtrA